MNPEGARCQNHVCRRPDAIDYSCGKLKLCAVLRTMAGENVDSLGANGMRKFDVRGVVANDKRPREVDFVIALRNPEKIGIRLHTGAAVSSLMRATINRSNARPCRGKTLHDVIIDSASLLGSDLSLSDPALVRDDEENEIGKAAQI